MQDVLLFLVLAEISTSLELHALTLAACSYVLLHSSHIHARVTAMHGIANFMAITEFYTLSLLL